MKAKIVACYQMSFLERLKGLNFVTDFKTIWELEDGRKVSITTAIPGGWWTEDALKGKVRPNFELKKQIGYEVILPDCQKKENALENISKQEGKQNE